MPTAQQILDVLRTHREELRRLGVRRLGLFGSAVRGEAKETSDSISWWNWRPRRSTPTWT